VGADNPGWVPPEARARKHDTDLSNRLADQAFDLLSSDAVLTIIGRQNAGKLPDCGAPARAQVIDLAGAGDAGIGTVILIRDHEYVCKDRSARRVREAPAIPGGSRRRDARCGAHRAGGLTDGAHDHQSRDRCADALHRAGFGDGAGIVIRRPGRVLAGGGPAAMEATGAASQIPADCHPEVYDEGFRSRVNAWAGQFGPTEPAGIVQASGLPGAG
jgi:hypothetical protein